MPWLRKLREILTLLNLKEMIKSELLSIKMFLVKVTMKIGREKYLLSILFWKLILGLINKCKELNRKKNERKFLWKTIVDESLSSHYPESHSHIRNKVKVVIDLTNYATKKELDRAIGIDTSDLAAKKEFVGLKTDVDKLDINKLANVPISLNNSKTEVDDSDVGKL